MFKRSLERIRFVYREFMRFPEYEDSPRRYMRLRWNMILLMAMITLIPLVLMTTINHYQYQKTLKEEIVQPLRVRVHETRRSLELFLAQRQSALSFIASAFNLEELSEEKTLNRIFRVMKLEIGGFVDLGVINDKGLQVNYTGPYKLQGMSYSDQPWFQEVTIRGAHISDVFMGHRQFPHFVIAVQHLSSTDEPWIIRATIDMKEFNRTIASIGHDVESDTFMVNLSGILQTPSKYYGKALDSLPLPLPLVTYDPNIVETVDPEGRDILLAYSYVESPHCVLMTVKPRDEILKAWYTLRSDILLLFLGCVIVICLVVFKLTGVLVRRIEASDRKREMASHQMEYTSKLASIGRLAAGVAHEINNPMAIINEKAGLMSDLIELDTDFPGREKMLGLTKSILGSVDRCRTITHRLLGFARRMDVQVEVMDLNAVIHEVIGFIEKEALHRNVEIRLQLAENLPRISSDQGQMQQVFLNLLNNALEAVNEGGLVVITSWDHDEDTVGISFKDNGFGMREETVNQIFEPFFTTKKGTGTGLGLSITYGIIKKLGGSIEVQSKEGMGATFTVFLPKKAKPGLEKKHG